MSKKNDKLLTGIKISKAYCCNCSECGRLHIWSKKTAEGFGMKYMCRCSTMNDIKKEDLM